MINTLFIFLSSLEDYLWNFLGIPALLLLGLYLSWKTSFIQVRKFPDVLRHFWSFLTKKTKKTEGVHPINAFFASLGGCVGVGNLVAVCTAVQIGGPGALFWLWITAIAGMTLKYAEVYLGFRYRVKTKEGGYAGGPMYFLQRVFRNPYIPSFVALLLCIYGVEIYQFNVVTSSLSANFEINRYLVSAVLLVLVILAGSGGVKRVGKISSVVIPIFMVFYLSMGLFVIIANIGLLPQLLKEMFLAAFTGHAAVGAFAGSSILLAASQGIRRACYSSDLGVGYASVIHSESSTQQPEKQASLAIFDIFLDTFCVCTTSILLILITGVWKEPLHESVLVQTALAQYFPHMHIFMPFFLFLLGYSTVISFFCFGLNCATYLSPRYGKPLFYLYAVATLTLFSFLETYHALIVMSITQLLLLLFNTYGIFYLRSEISFRFDQSTD